MKAWNQKIKVLVTWEEPWSEISGFSQIEFEFVQVPLTQIQYHSNPKLVPILKSHSGRVLIFSKAGMRGLALSLQNNFSILQSWKLAAVGPKTAQVIKDFGLEVDCVGSGTGLQLAQQLHESCSLEPWVLPVGDLGVEDVELFLKSKDRLFYRFEVYQNQEPSGFCDILERVLPDVQVILLASPSAVRRLFQGRDPKALPPLYSIGPTTSAQIQKLGGKVHWQAKKREFQAFVEGLKSIDLT